MTLLSLPKLVDRLGTHVKPSKDRKQCVLKQVKHTALLNEKLICKTYLWLALNCPSAFCTFVQGLKVAKSPVAVCAQQGARRGSLYHCCPVAQSLLSTRFCLLHPSSSFPLSEVSNV